jgi:hypothetical protein
MPPGIGYPGMVPVMGPDGTEEYVPEGMLPGAAPSLGVEPLAPPEALGIQPQAVEQVPPWAALPQEQAPPAPQAQPPFATSAKVSYSGYGQPQERLPTSKVTAPLYAQRAEIDRADQAAEQVAQDQEQLGQLQVAYDENVTAPMLQGKADLLGSYNQVRQNLVREFEGERNQREASIQQAIDSIPQSDPKRWWKNMSGFQKGAAYISAAIDGYLNPRGENGAVNLALQLADQDARAQAEDIATARAKVGYEQTAYERMLGNQQLKTQDYLAAKETALESLAVATEIRGMSFKSPITQMMHKQQADSMRAERMKVREERLGQLAAAESGFLNAEAQRRHESHMQSVSIAASERAAKAKAESEGKASPNILMDPAQAGRPWAITAKTADAEGRIKNWSDKEKGISGYATLTKQSKEYMANVAALGRTYGGTGANTAAVASQRLQLRANLKSQREQIVSDMRHDLFGSALTENEKASFTSMFPEPDSITGPTSTKALETFLRGKAQQAQDEFINPLGIVDAKTGKPVNLVEEWGTMAAAEENTPYLSAPDLVHSGQAVAAGMAQLPRDENANIHPGVAKAARQQAQLLEIRATELVNRAKNYASRSGMNAESAAQTLNTLKEWTAVTGDIAPDVSDRIMQKAIEFEKQINSVPPEVDPMSPVANPRRALSSVRTGG